jgi:hypothetical protein
MVVVAHLEAKKRRDDVFGEVCSRGLEAFPTKDLSTLSKTRLLIG